MLYPLRFYYVKKTKRFVISSSDKSSERNLSSFFDIIKPRRIKLLLKEEPFSSDPYFSILHFKGLGMINLQYEMRICQKSHDKVTKTVYLWFKFLWVRRYFRSYAILNWGQNLLILAISGNPVCCSWRIIALESNAGIFFSTLTLVLEKLYPEISLPGKQ